MEEDFTPCDGCNDDVSADHRCLNCHENFCSRCTESHRKMKMSRQHKLKELSTESHSVKRKIIKSRTFCTKHFSEQMNVVCQKCRVVLCPMCMLKDHQGHKSREVIEEAKEVKEKLQAEKKRIDEVLAKERKIISDLQESSKEIKSSLDLDKKALRDQGESLKRVVDETVELLEEDLNVGYKPFLDEIETTCSKLETYSLSLISSTTTAQHILEHSTDIELIEKGGPLREHIVREIGREPTDTDKNSRVNLASVFTRGKINYDSIQNMLGTVDPRRVKSTSRRVYPAFIQAPIPSSTQSIMDNEECNQSNTSGKIKGRKALPRSEKGGDPSLSIPTPAICLEKGNSAIATETVSRRWSRARTSKVCPSTSSELEGDEFKETEEIETGVRRVSKRWSRTPTSTVCPTFSELKEEKSTEAEILPKAFPSLSVREKRGHPDTEEAENRSKTMMRKRNTTKASVGTATVLPVTSGTVSFKNNLQRVGAAIVGKGSKTVSDIAPIDSRAWVCLTWDNKLQLIDCKGKSLLSTNVGTRICSIASDEEGNCIVSCYDKTIKRVTTEGKVEVIVSHTDGSPRGVAYRKRSDGTEEVMFSCTDVASGGSAVFVAPYRKAAEATPWFTGCKRISRIAVASDKRRVCIADTGGQNVIVLNEEGQFVCKTHFKMFKPFDVCFDGWDGIIVTEETYPPTPMLRLINHDSSGMETLKETGCTVAIDADRKLWIGKDKGVIEFYELGTEY